MWHSRFFNYNKRLMTLQRFFFSGNPSLHVNRTKTFHSLWSADSQNRRHLSVCTSEWKLFWAAFQAFAKSGLFLQDKQVMWMRSMYQVQLLHPAQKCWQIRTRGTLSNFPNKITGPETAPAWWLPVALVCQQHLPCDWWTKNCVSQWHCHQEKPYVCRLRIQEQSPSPVCTFFHQP